MQSSPQDIRSGLPSVTSLLESNEFFSLRQQFPKDTLKECIRKVLEKLRCSPPISIPTHLKLATEVLRTLAQPISLYSNVLNATGVLIHTNLGRVPLPKVTNAAIQNAFGYCDVEYEIQEGKRALRGRKLSKLLQTTTGFEAGTALNNNAAGLLLALQALSHGVPKIALARSQMVEIGGSFRLPEMLEAGGCEIFELGASNSTRLSDYQDALSKGANCILLVHESNFYLEGNVKKVEITKIVELGQKLDIPIIYDLGHGLLRPIRALPNSGHSIQELSHLGLSALCTSGDKLLGSCQAGLILGPKENIQKIEMHPLARALRCDKIQLAILMATLTLYEQERTHEIPLFQMIEANENDLKSRVLFWQAELHAGTCLQVEDAIGGGSMPRIKLPGYALGFNVKQYPRLEKKLRLSSPPLIGIIQNETLLLHARTLWLEEDPLILRTLQKALQEEDTCNPS